MNWEEFLEASKDKTEEEKWELHREYVKFYQKRAREEGPLLLAKFTTLISQLNCVVLGLDAGWGLRVSDGWKDDMYSIVVDCSDTFEFASGDNESLSSMEDLERFKKIVHWFLERNYTTTEWYKKYYPTFEDYLRDDGFPNYCLSNEDEEEMSIWLSRSYCMLTRGYEVHPYYWDQCPDWLKTKLQEAGVEPHPYRK